MSTVDDLDREAWRRFLLQASQSHPFHTWEWGDYIGRSRGRKVSRIAIRNRQGDLLGLYSMALRPAFVNGQIADSIPMYENSGPILRDDLTLDERKEAHGELVRFLREEARRRRIIHSTTRIWDPDYADSGCLRKWVDAGYGLLKHTTLEYLLPEDESSIMGRYDHDFRNQVRQGLRKGGVVEVNTPVDARAIYAIYVDSMKQAGVGSGYSFDEIASILDFREQGFRDVYLCKYEAKVIAFAICVRFNRTAAYWLSGTDRRYSTIRPMNIIIDRFIKNSISQGIRRIDFGGSPNKLSLSEFKQSIGTKPTPVYILTKTFSPLFHVHNLARSLWDASGLESRRRFKFPV